MLFKVRLSKERKKGDKIVSDSQERAYWRVHRPPPGFTSSLEPVPVRNRGGTCSRKRRTSNDLRREVSYSQSLSITNLFALFTLFYLDPFALIIPEKLTSFNLKSLFLRT